MNVDIDELERVAKDAVREHENWHRADDLIDDRGLHQDDAEHIAANSPPVTLALTARIRELEAGLNRLSARGKPQTPWIRALIAKGAVLP